MSADAEAGGAGRPPPAPHAEAGRIDWILLVQTPPTWTYLPPDKPGPTNMRREPGAGPLHNWYTAGHVMRTIDWLPFRGRLNGRLGLAVCRMLRARGGALPRPLIPQLLPSHFERDLPPERLAGAVRFALHGCRANGWIRTVRVDVGQDARAIPGAPCAHCGAWLTPCQRERIARTPETPYKGASVAVCEAIEPPHGLTQHGERRR